MIKTSDFGKAIMHRLVDLEKDQVWLMEQVREKTGLYMDSSYLHKIKTGKAATPKIVAAIREILELPEENRLYENEDGTTTLR